MKWKILIAAVLIAGVNVDSIAEAFFGVPDEFICECQTRLPVDMLEVLR